MELGWHNKTLHTDPFCYARLCMSLCSILHKRSPQNGPVSSALRLLPKFHLYLIGSK